MELTRLRHPIPAEGSPYARQHAAQHIQRRASVPTGAQHAHRLIGKSRKSSEPAQQSGGQKQTPFLRDSRALAPAEHQSDQKTSEQIDAQRAVGENRPGFGLDPLRQPEAQHASDTTARADKEVIHDGNFDFL